MGKFSSWLNPQKRQEPKHYSNQLEEMDLAFLIQNSETFFRGGFDSFSEFRGLSTLFGYENLLAQVQRSPYHFATEVILVAFIIYILLAKRSYDPQKK
jgi:hypothetical protein